MCCPTNIVKSSEVTQKVITRRQVRRHFTGHGADQCRNGFGYELQFLLSGVLLVIQNLSYKVHRRLSDVLPNQHCKVIRSDTKSFNTETS